MDVMSRVFVWSRRRAGKVAQCAPAADSNRLDQRPAMRLIKMGERPTFDDSHLASLLPKVPFVSHRKESAEDGWKRMLAWFKKHGV
jgi:dienelactone hydrolase